MTEPIRIALVDDHRLFRDGLRLLMSADRRFEVVGEAASGEEFLELETETDVVFMDIDMPGIGGVEATRRAMEHTPELKIIALSMHGEQEFYLPMVEAGAKGFLLKNSEFAEVAAAAERVAEGGTYFSPELMDALVEAMNRTDNSGASGVEPLSERETEILPLVCEGLANHEIAERLFISKRTVDKHRANILAKTGCKNTASLVIHAVKNNLIKI
jgi:DNA-binding NarL/FixJ family response regulator